MIIVSEEPSHSNKCHGKLRYKITKILKILLQHNIYSFQTNKLDFDTNNQVVTEEVN